MRSTLTSYLYSQEYYVRLFYLNISILIYASFMGIDMVSLYRQKLSHKVTISVPMARGRHLFPCRTQKLSLAAVTILGQSKPGKIARCRIIQQDLRIGGLLSFLGIVRHAINLMFSILIHHLSPCVDTHVLCMQTLSLQGWRIH